MSETVKIAIQGDAKGLVSAAKAGDKALDGLGDQAKVTGRNVDEMGRDVREAEQKVDRLGVSAERTTRTIDRLGRASHGMKSAGRVIGWGSEKIVNQYTALAGGAGIVMATKRAMDFKHALNMVAISARDSQGKVEGMDMAAWLSKTQAKIQSISAATGVPLLDIVAGIDAIKSRTGNMKQASDEMELLTKTSVATGSSVQDVFAIASNLDQKGGIKNVQDMSKAFTILYEAGKAGAFEFKDFASQGEELFSVMSLYGKMDIGGLKSFSAFAQMAKMSSASAAEAATAIKRLGAFMSNTKKVEKKLAKVGILVKLDERASMEENIKKIISKTGGKFGDIALKRLSSSDAFGEEGIKVIAAFANEFAKGHGFKLFDSLKEAGGDLEHNNSLMTAFKLATSDASGQMGKLTSAFNTITVDMLGSPMTGLTASLDWINTHGEITRAAIYGITTALLAMGAAVGAMKLATLVSQFNSIRQSGRGGLGGSAAGAIGAAGATPVFVVNMGAGGMLGGPANSAAVAAEATIAESAVKRGFFARTMPTFARWIETSKGWIGRSAQSLGVWSKGAQYTAERVLGRYGAGRFMMRNAGTAMEYGTNVFRNATWGSNLLGMSARTLGRFGSLAGGLGPAALVTVPIEWMLNGVNLRSTVGGLGTAAGGTAGAALGGISGLGVASVPVGIAGGILGGYAGNKASLAAYDLIASYFQNSPEAKGLAAADQKRAFSPIFNVGVNFDAMGRPTTQVTGDGSLSFKVNAPTIAPAWAM